MKIPLDIRNRYKVEDFDASLFLDHWDEPLGKVLVVGAHDEPTANILSASGYNVTGIDLREYDKSLPICNYKYVRGDFCGLDISTFQDKPYDVFVALSCIEHFGLGTYNEGHTAEYYDVVAMRRAWELLRMGGRAYITVPFCGFYHKVGIHWRQYNWQAAAERLIQDFGLVRMKCIVAADCIIWGVKRKMGEELDPTEALTWGGNLPHVSALFVLERVPVTRLAPDGR